jgi:putative hydrolase of the HAD superfamily
MSRFIDYLNQKKIPIVLLSNTNELHFNYCLRTFPVFKKIPKYFLSYELGIRKPSKEIFQKLIAALDLKPEELLFVDDIEENIIAAEGMGINTIHYVSHDNFLQKIREFNIM